MALDGSPKKFAQDVSTGLLIVSQASIKRFSPLELRKIMEGLQSVSKEIRTEAVDPGNYEALKMKNMKQQRVNGAMRVIQTYFRENRMNP